MLTITQLVRIQQEDFSIDIPVEHWEIIQKSVDMLQVLYKYDNREGWDSYDQLSKVDMIKFIRSLYPQYGLRECKNLVEAALLL